MRRRRAIAVALAAISAHLLRAQQDAPVLRIEVDAQARAFRSLAEFMSR